MQLEEGKTYRTRDGVKVGPMVLVENTGGRFKETGKGMSLLWFPNGKLFDETDPDPADLVALWDDTPAASSGAMREKLNSTPYDLVPYQEITDAYSRVAEHGADKYEPWNWSRGLSRIQILCSLLRHTFAYLRGQDRDKDSGLLHTDHILWNAVALSHNVHWSLEDGRRVEPEREYKTLDNVAGEE